MYIDDYQPHFITSRIYMYKRTPKQRVVKNKLSHDFDKLFFHFLSICKYEMPLVYTKHEERNIKLKMAQQMEQFKFPHKDALLNDLCYNDCIDLRVLSCLASFYHINLIFYHGKIMFKMLHEMDNPFYWVNEHKEIVPLTEEKYNLFVDNGCHEIKDICKTLYSQSKYKVDDLKNMVYEMGLFVHEEKMRKKDYFELIEGYMNRILF